MKELVPYAGFWFWWIVAALLLITELLVPGVFFIWVALAAAMVGLLTLFISMGWQAEVFIFTVLSLINVYVFYPYYIKFLQGKTTEPHLNDRAQSYVGKVFRLEKPIHNGEGGISIDGTLWRVIGRDQAAGENVRITGVNGMNLQVEPAP